MDALALICRPVPLGIDHLGRRQVDNAPVTGIPLFRQDTLNAWLLGERLQMVHRAIANANDDYLLNTREDELLAEFSDMCTLEPVVIHRSRIGQLSAHTVGQDAGSRSLRVRFSIPFSGPVQLLRLKPKRFSLNGPVVDQVSTETIEVVVDANIEIPGHAVTLLEVVLDQIDEPHLTAAKEQVEEYNLEVGRILARDLPIAKSQAAKAREAIKALPYPLVRRSDASTYSVPVTQRTIRPKRQQPSSFELTPVLEDGDYEAVLEILHSMRTMIERNPTTFAKLALQEPGRLDKVEERYRDLFLVMLNTIFIGEVAGEVFNGLGKTDILVRSKDKNVFIGECKFWTGSSDFREAVNQMLRYPAWRDTKAGLLLFIRNQGVKATIAKAVAELATHSSYVEQGQYANELRHDVVMRSLSDPDQHIRVALLPFAIPSVTPSAAQRNLE